MASFTDKEYKFIQAKLTGLNNEQSAIKAGYSPKSARTSAYNLMKRPDIQSAIGITVEDLGVTFKDTIKPFIDALKATKISTDKESGEQFDTGIPDHSIRMNAGKQLLKMQGYDRSLKDDEPNKPVINPTNIINMNDYDEIKLQQVVLKEKS